MALIDRKMPAADLANEQFAFSSEEFDKHLRYRAVELDNGAVLMAEADRFDDVFSREELDGQGRGMERFWTEGRVEDERVRQTK